MNPDPQQLFDREERVSAAFVWLVMLGLLFIAYAVFGKAILESPRAATVMKSAAMNYFPPPATNGVMIFNTFTSPPGVLLFSVESRSGVFYGTSNLMDWSAVRSHCDNDSGAYSENVVGYDMSGDSSYAYKSTP